MSKNTHCDAGPPSPTAIRLAHRLAEKFLEKGQALVIKPDGSITTVTPENGTDFQLEELNRFVDGYIEVIRPPGIPGVIMVINEEGKLKDLKFNAVATVIWQVDAIVGNALLCHSDQVK
jgi:uncharacterized linocin/CFP29 family protein